MNRGRIAEIAKLMRNKERPYGVKFYMNTYMLVGDAEARRLATAVARKYATGEEIQQFAEANFCNTAACIAGLTVIHYLGLREAILLDAADTYGNSIEHKAQRLLDLTDRQADALFTPETQVEITKQHAVAMLEWLATATAPVTDYAIKVKWAEVLAEEGVVEA